VQTLLQDLCYGIRILLKKPAFSLITVITLALGIGANTAIFSLVNAVLWKSLPVKEPEQLVQFKWLAGPGFGNKHHKEYYYAGNSRTDEATGLRLHTSFPRQTFEEFSKQQGVFTKLFAFSELEQVNANADGQAEVADGLVVSGGYFSGLGVRPWLGRTVAEEDDRSYAPAVVVLSFHYWQRRFGENPAVIGKQINLNNAAFTIIGITPPEFAGTIGRRKAPDLTIPLAQALLPMSQPAVKPGFGEPRVEDERLIVIADAG
jgi:macrolide transport system ATP-binding/permease protein